MIDESRIAQIYDYVDGALPEAEAHALETWLEGNSEGQALVAELRTLQDKIAALPKGIPPERDLWAGIAGQIGGTREATARTFWERCQPVLHRPVVLAAAALLLVLPSIHLFHALSEPVDEKNPPPRALRHKLDQAEMVYERARNDVLGPLRGEDTPLSAETLQVVEENLARIDSAVAEIETALLEAPDNPRLVKMLIATRERERSLLRQLGELSQGG